MRRTIAIAVLLVLTAPALAQQPSPPVSEQALAQKLMTEINAGIQCSATTITLQQQLAAAQAEIKELKAKMPKDEPPK